MLVSSDYLDRVEQIADIPPDYIEMKERSLRDLLEYGNTFLQRGRALTDAYHIAVGDWRRDPDWSPKDIRVIAAEAPKKSAGIDDGLWRDLLDSIQTQIKEIPDSYADFQTKPDFRAPDKSDVDAYIAWFTRYLPVLTLDLEPHDPGAWAEAMKRLKWMLDQGPDDISFETTLEADALRHLLFWIGSAGRDTRRP